MICIFHDTEFFDQLLLNFPTLSLTTIKICRQKFAVSNKFIKFVMYYFGMNLENIKSGMYHLILRPACDFVSYYVEKVSFMKWKYWSKKSQVEYLSYTYMCNVYMRLTFTHFWALVESNMSTKRLLCFYTKLY